MKTNKLIALLLWLLTYSYYHNSMKQVVEPTIDDWFTLIGSIIVFPIILVMIIFSRE